MPDIGIIVKDKIATGDKTRIINGNSDYTVNFTFDDEWSEFDTKTMRVKYNDGTYTDTVFTGTSCALPVIVNRFGIEIGVFADNLHTTTGAFFKCIKSIICSGGLPVDPPESVYNQLLEKLDAISVPEAVLYAEQELTAEQQQQARGNIDAVGKNEKLANPQKLTFRGQSSATYDGSQAVTVKLPEDGMVYSTLADFVKTTTRRYGRVNFIPTDTITPGSWSEISFPVMAYTDGISHGAGTIYMQSLRTGKLYSVQMDTMTYSGYKGPTLITETSDLSLGIIGVTEASVPLIVDFDSTGKPTKYAAVPALAKQFVAYDDDGTTITEFLEQAPSNLTKSEALQTVEMLSLLGVCEIFIGLENGVAKVLSMARDSANIYAWYISETGTIDKVTVPLSIFNSGTES